MGPLTLRYLPDLILHVPCSEVTNFNNELRDVIEGMFCLMDEHEGLGLAAPQVGLSWRLFVTNDKGNWTHPIEGTPFPFPLRRVFVNPAITVVGPRTKKSPEGCLSFPGVSDMIERAAHIRVDAVDGYGNPFTLDASGLFGACIQHETDHLEGIKIEKRLGSLARRLFLTKYQKTKR